MSKLFIEDTTLSAIGDAIRSKTGGTELIAPLDMPTAIGGIETGGGGGLTEWTINLTSTSTGYTHPTAANIFKEYMDGKSFTINLNNAPCYLFASNDQIVDLSKVVVNLNYTGDMYSCASNMFNGCYILEYLPVLNIAENVKRNGSQLYQLFQYCYRLKYIDSTFWQNIISLMSDYIGGNNISGGNMRSLFNGCYSLRELPDMTLLDGFRTSQSTVNNNLYRYFYQDCYVLNTIEHMPVIDNTTINMKSNLFSNTFSQCHRIKDMIFATDNGTPYVRSWSNQAILLDAAGYAPSNYATRITGWNSGITANTQIIDDATYAALKDNPDSWTADAAYSRYNHDSAVRTINSLPDCSSGSGNTITFKGTAGSATDGGAINTLTEAEIAVATAKGWTVSLA